MSNVNGESDVTPTEFGTTRTVGNLSHGSRETPAISVHPWKRIGCRAAATKISADDIDIVLMPSKQDGSVTPRVLHFLSLQIGRHLAWAGLSDVDHAVAL